MPDKDILEGFRAIWHISKVVIIPPIFFAVFASTGLLLVARFVGTIRPIVSYVILLMFGVFGSVLGVLTGVSKESVVGVLLPPLITAVVGFVGYLTAAKIDTEVRQLVPLAIVNLLLCTLCGAFYGAFLKA